MKSDTSELELLNRANGLARVAPTEWEFFIKALERRVQESVEYMIGSDKENVQLNQGRVQAYSFMWRTCRDCKEKMDEIERQQRGR